MEVPILSYRSESWIITKRQESRIQTEMKYPRAVRGCSRVVVRFRNELDGTGMII